MAKGCSMPPGWMVHAQRMVQAQQMLHAQGFIPAQEQGVPRKGLVP